MRNILEIGALCAMTMTAMADVELFGIARDLNDNTHLIKIDPTDALSMQVVAPLNASDVSWLDYDPTTNTLIVHDDTQVYRVDPQTGNTIADAQPSGAYQMQGVDFVPGLGNVVAYGPRGNADKLGIIQSDGTVTNLFTYPGLLDFDEVIWDGVRDQLYVSATQQQVLYTIDEDTGDVLNTNNLPSADGTISRASINPETGVMYEVGFVSPNLQNTIYLRDPVSGARPGTTGTLPGFNHIHGLAFTPEPSSIVGLALVGLTLLRRRA